MSKRNTDRMSALNMKIDSLRVEADRLNSSLATQERHIQVLQSEYARKAATAHTTARATHTTAVYGAIVPHRRGLDYDRDRLRSDRGGSGDYNLRGRSVSTGAALRHT
jgi:hypothetical protein